MRALLLIMLTLSASFALAQPQGPCEALLSRSLGPLSSVGQHPSPHLRKAIGSGRAVIYVSRGLQDYCASAHPGFIENLVALRKGQSWIDIGAGEARAAAEYLTLDKIGRYDYRTGVKRYDLPPIDQRANVVALDVYADQQALESWRPQIEKGQLTFFETTLHQYALAHPASMDLALDNHAATLYAQYMAVKDMVRLLKPGGKAYFHGVYAHIKDKRGREISPLEYLQMGRGFRVVAEDDPNNHANFEVTRTRGPIWLPALKYKRYTIGDDGPETWYQLTD